jgi:hypothetical protein
VNVRLLARLRGRVNVAWLPESFSCPPALRRPRLGSDYVFVENSTWSVSGRRTCACECLRASLPDVPNLPHGPDQPPPEGLLRSVRAARSRQRKAETRRERDAEIRALLEAALKRLRDNP